MSGTNNELALSKPNTELYLVELPFKAANINPKGPHITSIKAQISKHSKTLKLANDTFKDVKLARKPTPKLAYVKKTYKNSHGETKVVYELIEKSSGFQY
jgi:hypothetical protein